MYVALELLSVIKLVSRITGEFNGPDEGFNGLEMVTDAVKYMFSRKSIGKVYVIL